MADKIQKKINISVYEMFCSTVARSRKWHLATSKMFVDRMFPEQWVMYYDFWMSDLTRSPFKSKDCYAEYILRAVERALDKYGIKWSIAPSRSPYQKSMSEYRYIHRVRFLPDGIRILMRFPENMRKKR